MEVGVSRRTGTLRDIWRCSSEGGEMANPTEPESRGRKRARMEPQTLALALHVGRGVCIGIW